MAQKDIYTLGFLAGGYKAVAQFKGIDLAQLPAPPEKNSPLHSLLVGWDAADWQVMTPLLTSGKMPHLDCFDGRWGTGPIGHTGSAYLAHALEHHCYSTMAF